MNQLHAVVNDKQVVHVVEDDAGVRNSLKFTLEVEGYEVHAYASARELLNEESLPTSGCLITDYHMPEMNGLELVAQLRDRNILLPVILITGHPNENMRNRAAAAGIPIVEKPVLGGHLLDTIREAFNGYTKSSS
jgi:two-component system, LuxR family, response regulator FixJ